MKRTIVGVVGGLVLAPVAALAAWQGVYVAYDERQRDMQSNKLTPQKQRFFIGSTDDMIKDSLKTGDLLLFSRPWYRLRTRAAIKSFVMHRMFLQAGSWGGE